MHSQDQEKLLNVEGWSNDEKIRFLSISHVLTILALFSSLYLFISPLLIATQIPPPLIYGASSTGLFGLVTSLFVLWCISSLKQEISALNQFESNPNSQRYGGSDWVVTLTFTLTIFMTCICAILFMYLWVQYPYDYEHFQALGINDAKILQKFKLYFYLMIAACVLIGILFWQKRFFYYLTSLISFAFYVSAIQQEQIRVTIHFNNLILMIMAMATLFFGKQSLQYANIQIIQKQVKTEYIQNSIWYAFVIAIISVLIYLVNLKKSKIQYFIAGSLLVVILFVNQAFHFHVYRDTTLIRQTILSNCGILMRDTSSQYLLKSCYCQKYEKDGNDYKTTCSTSQNVAVRWEDDVGKPLDQQQNALGCLNMNCCGNLATSYSKWFFALSFSTGSILVFGFALLAAHMYISQRPPFKKSGASVSDIVFGILLILVFSGGIYYYFKNQVKALPPQKPNLLEQTSIQLLDLEDYTITPVQSTCQLLINSLNTQQIKCTGCSQTDKYRISVNAGHDTLTQSVALNYDSSIQQVPSSLAALQLYSSNIPSTTLSVQGNIDKITEFITQYAYLCTSGQNSQLQVNLHKIPPPVVSRKRHQDQSFTFNLTNHKDTPVPLKIGDLFKKQFTNIEIQVFNSITSKQLTQFSVDLKQLDVILRTENSQSSVSVTFYNIQFGSYSLLIRKKGYFQGVQNLVIQQNQHQTFVKVFLFPQFKDDSILQIVFKQPSPKISLQASYLISDTQVCSSGYLTGDCEGMTYKQFQTETQFIQSITFKSLAPKNYLVYLQYLNQNPEISTINQNIFKTGQKPAQADLNKIDNSYFFTSGVELVIYSQYSLQPVLQLQPSAQQQQAESHEPNLTWLAFCFDGSQDGKNVKTVNKFWNYNDNPSPFERKYSYKNSQPNANICSNV